MSKEKLVPVMIKMPKKMRDDLILLGEVLSRDPYQTGSVSMSEAIRRGCIKALTSPLSKVKEITSKDADDGEKFIPVMLKMPKEMRDDLAQVGETLSTRQDHVSMSEVIRRGCMMILEDHKELMNKHKKDG